MKYFIVEIDLMIIRTITLTDNNIHLKNLYRITTSTICRQMIALLLVYYSAQNLGRKWWNILHHLLTHRCLSPDMNYNCQAKRKYMIF